MSCRPTYTSVPARQRVPTRQGPRHHGTRHWATHAHERHRHRSMGWSAKECRAPRACPTTTPTPTTHTHPHIHARAVVHREAQPSSKRTVAGHGHELEGPAKVLAVDLGHGKAKPQPRHGPVRVVGRHPAHPAKRHVLVALAVAAARGGQVACERGVRPHPYPRTAAPASMQRGPNTQDSPFFQRTVCSVVTSSSSSTVVNDQFQTSSSMSGGMPPPWSDTRMCTIGPAHTWGVFDMFPTQRNCHQR